MSSIKIQSKYLKQNIPFISFFQTEYSDLKLNMKPKHNFHANLN